MKNKIFTLVIFFIVALFISVAINTVESIYKNDTEMNMLQSKDSIGFQINGSKEISGQQFMELLQNEPDIIVQKDGLTLGIFQGRAIYFGKKVNIQVPLIDGRFITTQDFIENAKVAVIGKNLKHLTFIKNGKEYIRFEQEEYLVVGTLGHANRSSNFDDRFFLSLNGLLPQYTNLEALSTSWILDNDHLTKDVQDSFSNLNGKVAKLNNKVKLENTYTQTSKSYLDDILSNGIFIMGLLALVIIVLLLNVVNTTNFYLESKRKEIGVRKTYGADNWQIAQKILLDYELQAISAFILALLFYAILIKFKINTIIFGDYIYLLSPVIAFVGVLTIGSIIALIPIIKSFKLQPNEILKGR